MSTSFAQNPIPAHFDECVEMNVFVVMGTEFPTKDGHSAGKNMEITFTTGK
ncbi:MAG: hypothetical protein J6T13_09030 [Bacteroidales bacterium]|nr:hypothetical protein [Bacteroidales bacterium]MCR4856971.1 hypothetical protein [Bacteroidales bacterium]